MLTACYLYEEQQRDLTNRIEENKHCGVFGIVVWYQLEDLVGLVALGELKRLVTDGLFGIGGLREETD